MRFLKFIILLSIMLSITAFAEERLSFSSKVTECVNHWVALGSNNDYTYGFIYIDEQAGFTYHIAGRFKLDDSGHYIKLEDDIIDKKAFLIKRLGQNGMVAALSKEAIDQLGLPEKPDWLNNYDDGSNSPLHRTRIGYWFNELGDYERAILVLESAYKDQPTTERLEFELAYAYNALEQFEKSLPVLSGALKRDPEDVFLGSELAYTNYRLGNYNEAINLYLKFIPICPAGQIQLKSEMAMNLSDSYSKIGLNKEAKLWLKKAKEWAPEGSPLSQYFKQGS